MTAGPACQQATCEETRSLSSEPLIQVVFFASATLFAVCLASFGFAWIGRIAWRLKRPVEFAFLDASPPPWPSGPRPQVQITSILRRMDEAGLPAHLQSVASAYRAALELALAGDEAAHQMAYAHWSYLRRACQRTEPRGPKS